MRHVLRGRLGLEHRLRSSRQQWGDLHTTRAWDDEGRKIFIADNNGFDWQFINWYFHHFLGENPFGFSSQNLGSLYKGLVKDVTKNFKHLRKTAHTHDPVDDALGNAEALLHMRQEMGLSMPLD